MIFLISAFVEIHRVITRLKQSSIDRNLSDNVSGSHYNLLLSTTALYIKILASDKRSMKKNTNMSLPN